MHTVTYLRQPCAIIRNHCDGGCGVEKTGRAIVGQCLTAARHVNGGVA
jgi:hypothetical protein